MSQGYVETSLVECNRLSSEQAKSGNNVNTSEWRNNLNDVFHLNAGDKVSVYSSFVSESGAGTLDTIEIKGVSLKETKSFTYIKNVTKEVLEGIGQEFTNGFLTNGIKGDFSQPIEAYYREITDDIELRDDEVNLIVEYYKTLDGNGYTQLPRKFIPRVSSYPLVTPAEFPNSFPYAGAPNWTGDPATDVEPSGFPWANTDGDNTGRSKFSLSGTNSLPPQYLKSDFRTDAGFLKVKQDNSKMALFVRKNQKLNIMEKAPTFSVNPYDITDDSQYFSMAPESFPYIWYREKKNLKLPTGFVSAKYVAEDLSRQLQAVTDDYQIQETSIVDDLLLEQDRSRIIETETYKTFYTNTQNFTEDDFDLAKTQNTESKFYENFNTIGIKRPEIWNAGRKININASYDLNSGTRVYNEQQYNSILRGTEVASNYHPSQAEPLKLNIPYTKANLLLLKDFIDAQALYPEIFEGWNRKDTDTQRDVPYYSNKNTINNCRWFHINQKLSQPYVLDGTSASYNFGGSTDDYYNSDIVLKDPATATGEARLKLEDYNRIRVYLGYGNYKGQVAGTRHPSLVSRMILFHYNPTYKDIYLDSPTKNIADSDGTNLKLTYGCFSKSTDGFVTIFTDYAPDDLVTPADYFNSPGFPYLNLIEQGRKIGFDEHFTAFGTLAVCLENGVGCGVNYYCDPDSSQYVKKRYIGAQQPTIGFDGDHFYFSQLHTDMRIGNHLLSGGNVAQFAINGSTGSTVQPYISLTQTPTSVPTDVCYRLNPEENYTEFCVERCPYEYARRYETANGVFGNTTAEPPTNPKTLPIQPLSVKTPYNTQLEKWTIYDSPTGIGILDLGFTLKTWNNSVWNTLGFSYEQFHSSTNNRLQRINSENINDLSYLSTNAQVSSFDSSLWVVNDASIPLIGQNIPTSSNMYAYTNGGSATGASSWNTNTFYPEVEIKTHSIQVTADNFPVSMKHGYYTIRSDIVPDSRFVGGKTDNTNMPIVGVINKENPQSDYYFAGESDVEFVITKPTILSSINIALCNPDGSYATTSPDSSVIFKVQRQMNTSFNIVEEILNEPTKKK